MTACDSNLTSLSPASNIAVMQTLGLSEGGKKTDGRLKSLFWPTIENAWDVDYLGQQGFWVCLVIGIFNLAAFLLLASFMPATAARTVMLAIGTAMFFVHWVGGMGVREHSFPAALTVFVVYVVNQLASGQAPGILPILIGALLLSNVRATYLASRWKPVSEDEDRPTRFNETFRDKLVDQLPAKLWPILKIPFFIGAALVLLAILWGSLVVMRQRQAHSTYNDNSVPSEIVVAPPDTH
jgi:hypothetical protein